MRDQFSACLRSWTRGNRAGHPIKPGEPPLPYSKAVTHRSKIFQSNFTKITKSIQKCFLQVRFGYSKNQLKTVGRSMGFVKSRMQESTRTKGSILVAFVQDLDDLISEVWGLARSAQVRLLDARDLADHFRRYLAKLHRRLYFPVSRRLVRGLLPARRGVASFALSDNYCRDR